MRPNESKTKSPGEKSAARGRGRADAGQTLIIVVLIMLAVALLAALFITIIITTQARAGRQAEALALDNIAEAGIRYADYQLTYSADGADWRPVPYTTADPYPYSFGGGEFRLELTYNPTAGDPLSRFIKIECVARLQDNPFIKRTVVAYKPILLADYLRFATNKDLTSLPAVFGVPEVSQGAGTAAYLNGFWGPIRANTDVEWHKSALSALNMYLVEGSDGFGYPRFDSIASSGSFMLAYGQTPFVYINPPPYTARTAYASDNANFDIALGLGDGVARYMDGLNIPDTNEFLRTTRFQSPPLIDTTDPTTGQSRYLLGTRDSGEWLAASNTRQGIYIDNPNDIQNQHDLAALRDAWMNPGPARDYWDTGGWSYTPPGVEIVLHPDDAGTAAGYPVIEMTRFDATWKYSDGSDTGSYTVYLPYPPNGVLYAEGNLRVSGVLPAATAAGLTEYFDDNGTPAIFSDDSRYFDLTIVSGGTIYIEGDIMSPSTYIDNGGTLMGYAAHDNARNSRVALLARDYVCLNATALGARLDPVAANTTATFPVNYWKMAPTNQISWQFRSHQPTVSPILYVRHAGELGVLGAWDDGAGTLYPSPYSVTVGITPLDWSGAANTIFYFQPTYAANMYQSPRETGAVALADRWEVSVRAIPEASLTTVAGATCRPPTSIVAANVGAAATNNDVAIAGFQVLPQRVDIDALIYAQEGSWFVLGGPWFNGTWPYTGNLLAGDPVDDTAHAAGVPSYRMALGSIQLTGGVDPRPTIWINGAIAENYTATLGDAHDWLSKWSGPEVMLDYNYDAGLRSVEYGDVNGKGLMRLPKMPCPEGVILWSRQ